MPVKGTTYVFNGHARDGIHGPVQFQNKPEDFRKVQFRYQVDPGVTQIFPFQMLGAVPQYMSVRWSTDLPLSSPFEQEGYHIPAPYPEFDLGFVRKEIYPVGWAGGVPQDPELSYLSPFLRPQDRQIWEGYFFDGFAGETAGYRRLVLATNARELPSGIGPYNWYGRFDNRTTEIRLRPVIGSFPWFFLGQLMDLRPHDPLPYELYRSGAVIKSGSFPAVGDPSASNSDVIIPVNAGLYTLKIPFTNYWISGKQGSALLEATFDTGKSDRNPPYLLQFGITEDGRVADTIVSGSGQVNFKAADDIALKQASLFYDAGTGWQDFTLNKVGDIVYQGNIPTFPKDTFLALKVLAEDRSGNRISYEMKPAVLVKATVQGNKPVFAVNCGGPQYVDKSGVVYQADTLDSGGGTYKTTAPIDGTEDDLLYQSERYGNFSYNIPLPSGIYSVILKLAEIYYSSAGRRIFDVKIEGKEVITIWTLPPRWGGTRPMT